MEYGLTVLGMAHVGSFFDHPIEPALVALAAISSNVVDDSQPKNRIAVFAKIRSVAKRRDRGFRENQPRVFEIQKKRAGREAGVYDEYIIQNFVLRANPEANNYQYLT